MQTFTKLCVVKGVFDGIYFWGQGFKDNETARKWKEYWENIDDVFWEYKIPKHSMCSGILAETQGSIYLHPMNFRTVLRSCGGKSPRGNNDDLEDYFGTELDHLKDLCEKAAEACGGSFKMTAEAHTVYEENPREW